MIAKLKQRGQALVEFALAATLIFLLLAAAVDLGLMFFTVQGLHNAAQEGGTYGSRWLKDNSTTFQREIDIPTIRDRVRQESGSKGGINVVNLLDLNNNGRPDVNAGVLVKDCTDATCERNSTTGNFVVNDYIQVGAINDTNANGDPLDDGVAPTYTPCTNTNDVTCYLRVRVMFDYRLFFPLSPTFGKQRQLASSFVIRLRDDMARSGAVSTVPPFIPATNTPVPPSPTPIAVSISIVDYSYSSGSKLASVRAFVEVNGVPSGVASVSGTIGQGGSARNVTLLPLGSGYYRVCNVGPFTGTSAPSVSLTATFNGSSDSTSASGTSGSAIPGC
jgi:hypothetical protein